MIAALYEPEIPPNTGNIARLCAAFGVDLHLIGQPGFKLENRYLKRAGLDYWPHVRAYGWPSWRVFAPAMAKRHRLIAMTTKGEAILGKFHFEPEDCLVFGPETRGLPPDILARADFQTRIPIKRMTEGGARSLNLSTAAGIALFTAMSQCGLLENFS